MPECTVWPFLGLDTFWAWFERLTESQRVEAIGPVLNKLRDFLVRPRLRRLLCQPRSTVDLRVVVDTGKILLADLAVGRWGETTAAALIGSFLVAKLWQAVLARSGTAEEQRRDFFLFIDEFQHFLLQQRSNLTIFIAISGVVARMRDRVAGTRERS